MNANAWSIVLVVAFLLSSQPFPPAWYLHRAEVPQTANPAFVQASGATVCYDAGHHNFHPADGAYAPFAEMVASDGFRGRIVRSTITSSAIADCAVLVIATPTHPTNQEDWSLPHASAFVTGEIRAIHRWTRAGGGLLLIVDHSPVPGSVADLAIVFGVTLIDGEARNDPRAPLPDVFRREEGLLADHPVTRGRNDGERVDAVATWTGTAFRTSREFQPLLRYGPRSLAWAELPETLPDLPRADYPVFEIEGWSAAAARQVGDGRFVVLGETAMCTDQGKGDARRGMHADTGADNLVFCRNVVRWLAGALQ